MNGACGLTNMQDFLCVAINDRNEIQRMGIEIFVLSEASKYEGLLYTALLRESCVVPNGPSIAVDLLWEDTNFLCELLYTFIRAHNTLTCYKLLDRDLRLNAFRKTIPGRNLPSRIVVCDNGVIAVTRWQVL